MKVLVTGAAGFIGMHVTKRLLDAGATVVGVDNLNDYYDVRLKEARLNQLSPYVNFHFKKLDIADREAMQDLFAKSQFQYVINLAAQAGVRYSLKNPHAYVESNVVGFLNILEGCRHNKIEHLVNASSSSVYGSNAKTPFSEHDDVSHPVSLYAATKKADELMSHAYSHLYRIPITNLRFFTVYGPWGRPDMSPILFASAIAEGRPIDVFNYGKMQRDFTYIDDIVDGVIGILEKSAQPSLLFDREKPDPAISDAPYRVYNIGNSRPIELLEFIEVIENAMGKQAEKNMLPMQDGDVYATYADTNELGEAVGFASRTSVQEGVRKFVDWFKFYYQ